MTTEATLLRKRRTSEMKHFLAKQVLGTLGKWMPTSIRRTLVRQDPRLGFLYSHLGDVIEKEPLGKLKLWINAKSNIERAILSGHYEPDVVALVRTRVKPGWKCLDVGANVGFLSLLMAEQAGPSGRVLSVEPGPPFAERMRQNLALNPSLAGRVQIVQKGLSDQEGELHWNEDPVFPGNAWMLSSSGVSIPVTTVDNLISSLGWTSLDFVRLH